MAREIMAILQESPEVLVFLSLAIGYVIGKIKIKGFGIGTTASVLLVAMVLGQFTIDVPPILKSLASRSSRSASATRWARSFSGPCAKRI